VSVGVSDAGALRSGVAIEWWTIGWMALEAAVSLGAGTAAGSIALLAFGADSVVELISAGVLLRRLRVEQAGGCAAAVREAERRASWAVRCPALPPRDLGSHERRTRPPHACPTGEQPRRLGPGGGVGGGHALDRRDQASGRRLHRQFRPEGGRRLRHRLRLHGRHPAGGARAASSLWLVVGRPVGGPGDCVLRCPRGRTDGCGCP